jgi:hypothetical protein
MIELTGPNIIYIYAALVVISLVYLYYYRQNLVKQNVDQTKRAQAIEKFQTYTQAAMAGNREGFRDGNREGFRDGNREGFRDGNREGFRDGNREGFQDGGTGTSTRMPSDSKSSALGSRCLPDGKASVTPEMQSIPDDEFLLPGLSDLIHTRVNAQTLKRGQDLVINNIIIAFTKDVIANAQDTYADIQKIYSAATPATEFTQEERLELFFNNLDQSIMGFVRAKLESRLTTAFEQSQILSTNESDVRQSIAREIKERVFARLYKDALQLQAEICRTQSELTQKIESSSAGEIRFKLQTTQIQHRQILQSLIRLTETPATAEAIRIELGRLSDTTIQPAMETDLDTINSRRLGRMGMSISESGQEIGKSLDQVPSANAYKAYLDAAARRESEFKIDPINALDKMEKSTIGFLEQLGMELGMTQPPGQSPISANYSIDQANTTLSTPSINRFADGQSNNLGSWMQSGKSGKSGKSNNSKNNKKITTYSTRATTREGFEDSGKNSTSDSNKEADLGQQITGWSRYVYDFIKSNFDSEITGRAERILTDENNMVPIGILLILGSILLYFIDLSS